MTRTTRHDERYINPDDDPKGPYVLVDITAPFARPALLFELHGHWPPEGRSWRYSAARLAELEEQGAIFFPEHGRPRLKRYLSDTTKQDEPEIDPAQTSFVEVIVRKFMQALVSEVARNPSSLQTLEWRDLERVLREVFEGIGFSTRLTRPGKDGGFDLELGCIERGEKVNFLVEVKHWAPKSKPGRKIFCSFFDIVVRRKEPTGLLLSSSGFTKEVLRGRTEVERQRVRLGNAEKIVSLCQNYIESQAGVWTPTTTLPHILFDGTY